MGLGYHRVAGSGFGFGGIFTVPLPLGCVPAVLRLHPEWLPR